MIFISNVYYKLSCRAHMSMQTFTVHCNLLTTYCIHTYIYASNAYTHVHYMINMFVVPFMLLFINAF